jgi:hypothetical protein
MDLMPDHNHHGDRSGQSHVDKTCPNVSRHTKWTCPVELATYHDTIALFVAEFPTMPITDINQLKHVDS